MDREEMEFYCPYCRAWITDVVHQQHHHNDPYEEDKTRDNRVRVDGIEYEDEVHYKETARLMAAAPDLLEALEAMEASFCPGGGRDIDHDACENAWRMALHAIAKAKGGE